MSKLPLKNWKILNNDPNMSIIDILLSNRNLPPDHMEEFKLSDHLNDPILLKDMNKAVERILKAIDKKESITIFGDYDADGVISTTLMVKFFEKIGLPVNYILPNRLHDGYGLKQNGVEKSIQLNTSLLITVDNGITSNEAVEFANNADIDVIIFDHHVQEGELPKAHAIVNPNQKDCPYPFKGLCGAGVVYKFFHAIGPELFSEEDFKNFMLTQLDLVALATIADVVPLRDENYAIVKFGLKSLSKTLRPGIVELKRVGGLIGKDITTTAVGFYLAPRLNVAGRLEIADIAVNLLLSKTKDEAAELANQLNSLNSKRQKIQEQYINQAIKLVEESDIKNNMALIVSSEHWESGLIGIVSGRLKDKFNRPVIAFTLDGNGNYVGSARSIDSFHITDALSQFSELYINYGGHKKAAGLTLSPQNFTTFIDKFTKYSNNKLTDEDLCQNLMIDTVIHPEQLNESLVHIIHKVGPFGEDNPEPVLLIKKARIKEMFSLSQGRHLKFFVQIGNHEFECIWWRKGDLKDVISFNTHYDIAFKPSLNLWNGRETLQLIVEDVKLS